MTVEALEIGKRQRIKSMIRILFDLYPRTPLDEKVKSYSCD